MKNNTPKVHIDSATFEESRYSSYPQRIIKWKEIHYLSCLGMLNPTFLNIPALSGPFKNFTNSLAAF